MMILQGGVNRKKSRASEDRLSGTPRQVKVSFRSEPLTTVSWSKGHCECCEYLPHDIMQGYFYNKNHELQQQHQVAIRPIPEQCEPSSAGLSYSSLGRNSRVSVPRFLLNFAQSWKKSTDCNLCVQLRDRPASFASSSQPGCLLGVPS